MKAKRKERNRIDLATQHDVISDTVTKTAIRRRFQNDDDDDDDDDGRNK